MNNYEKMREVLEEIKKVSDDWELAITKAGALDTIYNLAQEALALPRRQCDVGTAEEQSDRFANLCDSHSGCSQCPVKALWNFANGHKPSCGVLWAQMPYKEGDEK